jgi:hypothetical protein
MLRDEVFKASFGDQFARGFGRIAESHLVASPSQFVGDGQRPCEKTKIVRRLGGK